MNVNLTSNPTMRSVPFAVSDGYVATIGGGCPDGAAGVPNFGPKPYLLLCPSRQGDFDYGRQHNDICRPDENHQFRKNHVLDGSGRGVGGTAGRTQLLVESKRKDAPEIDAEKGRHIAVSSGFGRRGGQRDRRTLAGLHVSGHRDGVCRRKGVRRSERYGGHSDILGAGCDHQRVCDADFGIAQVRHAGSGRGLYGRVLVRSGFGGAGAAGLRMVLPTHMGGRYDGECDARHLTTQYKYRNNLLQRAAETRALHLPMERG